ncbi:hypothetical protein V6N11_026144 [Hibiscus sabdariffa]|uniref:RNase H type-1 domain-containing protein n=1 Tax=Hibiscus sabdariffa TaxID=183260 RepID=A0ABR2SVF1_9ROSI
MEGWWCKAKWTFIINSADDILRSPFVLQFGKPKQIPTSRCVWECPSVGELKFNVDGVVAGAFGRAGIGGLLRNSNGKTLLMFSKSIGVIDVTSAEILALKEACVLFSQSRWVNFPSLVLETDCECLVEWFNRPVSTPSGYKKLVEECIESCVGCSWSIRAVPREANCTDDKLAKSSICKLTPLYWISNFDDQ